ncbi:MAG: hypothetical protein N2Z76_04210 [Treponemataceae bacterium]|nr:hypothetical protein [Treponemataceae bacterium]
MVAIAKGKKIISPYKALVGAWGLVLVTSGYTSPPLKIKPDMTEPVARIQEGQIFIRPLSSIRDSIFDFSKVPITEMEGLFKNINPNFLAEAVYVLPVKPGLEKKLKDAIVNKLKEVYYLDSIPYYSKRNKTVQPLFQDTIIIDINTSPLQTTILAQQKMLPFETSQFTYHFVENKDYFLFYSENSKPLVYNNISTAGAGTMRTALIIETYPGYLVFYGMGGARAFTFFGLLNDRLEMAFIGRIEAFYQWFFTQELPRIQNQF